MNKELLNYLKEYKVKLIPIVNDPSSKLNEKVKQIYVINMLEDIRKRNYIYILFKKYKINYNFVIVDKLNTSVYEKLRKEKNLSISELGCCLSHMWCLYHLLKNNYSNAIIFEDDVILSKTLVESFLNIYEMNHDLDFLMLGAHDYHFSKLNYKRVQNGMYRPDPESKMLYGAHANYYSYNGAKRMFYIRATHLSFFDNEYGLLFTSLPQSYVCYPNLVISNMSESRINHEKNVLSSEENDYYKTCFKTINFNNYNLIYPNLLDWALLKKNDNSETFVERCLFKCINDFNGTNVVKRRFALDFFTMDDIKNILSNYNLITPNNLSKKCMGENA